MKDEFDDAKRLNPTEYRHRLLNKLNCLISVLEVAIGKISASRIQLDAMRASALERRRAEPDTSGDKRLEALRVQVRVEMRGIGERERTPDGLAGILNAIRCRVKRQDMRGVLQRAMGQLRAMKGDV